MIFGIPTSCGSGQIVNQEVAVNQNATNIRYLKYSEVKNMTLPERLRLKTYITSGISIMEKVIPESTELLPEKHLVNKEGTAVVLKQYRIIPSKVIPGYKGSVIDGEQIQYLKEEGNYFVYKTNSDIWIYFQQSYNGYLVIAKIGNFEGIYNDSDFFNKKIAYSLEEIIEQVN